MFTQLSRRPAAARSSALQSFCDPKRAASCSAEQNNGSQTFICLMGADEYFRLISQAVAATTSCANYVYLAALMLLRMATFDWRS